MTELKCSVQTCTHNKAFLCALDGIEVRGESAQTQQATCCGSFQERRNDSYSNTVGTASEYSNITCSAEECTYNNSHKCEAGQISVEGSHADHSEQTECASFMRA